MTLNLTNLLAGQVTGYLAYDANYNIDNLKKINYVTAANGLFRVEKTPTAIFKTLIESYKKPIPGLEVMEEGADLLIPKIPFKYLQMALSFYLDVYDKDKTEASLLFFWNKDNKTLPLTYSDDSPVKGLLSDGQLVVYVPRQVNQSGLSEFHKDPMVDWLRNNLAVLAETHSHHVMNAFFSGTDDANENSTQFYGVWGHIKNDQPAFAFRYVCGDVKKKICPSVLFDWPQVVTTTTRVIKTNLEGVSDQTLVEEIEGLYPGPFPKVDYPAEWMEQHTKKYEVALKSTYDWGKDYLAHRNGHLEQLEAELPFDDDVYPYKRTASSRLPFSHSNFEDAEIVQFLDLKDEKNKFDIVDDILDLTAEYARLGYSKVIESAIDAVRPVEL
ncbi:hypothetical protein ACFX4N_23985 [Priestia sp. YIM B13551]|uniref:hypothetical protein n=1 Tax=Priestia sp. YIM B13551 TaxID=3366306 RepID=UPI00366CA89C